MSNNKTCPLMTFSKFDGETEAKIGLLIPPAYAVNRSHRILTAANKLNVLTINVFINMLSTEKILI